MRKGRRDVKGGTEGIGGRKGERRGGKERLKVLPHNKQAVAASDHNSGSNTLSQSQSCACAADVDVSKGPLVHDTVFS